MSAPLDMLSELSASGLSWRDVARLSRVSVPAVQKWRGGAGLTGESRMRLAGILALLDTLTECFINEPVSWLEMPVCDKVNLSRMDLVAADRTDLVIDLVRDLDDEKLAHHVLDEYQPDWRAVLVDERFETFVGNDGAVSIRPRSN